ncbi:MAG: efflux RND transporter permease subunit, partial [Thermoplasmatota archaeon]
MNLIGKYGKVVSKWPKLFIVFLVIITIILSFFASQMSMESGEDDFQPDTEIAEANNMINEKYGEEQNRITIVTVADDNVLSRESLVTQLDMEAAVLNSDTVTEIIKSTSQNPNGISSPAKLIAQSKFVNKSLSLMVRPEEGQSSSTDNTTQDVQKELMDKAFSLTPEEMKTILNGGELTIELSVSPQPVVLDFKEYTSAEITAFYQNPIISQAFPLEDILDFSLSNDYDTQTQTAKKSLMTVSIATNISEERTLEAEKKIKESASDTETDQTSLRVLGDALVNEEINEASGRNISILMPIAFVFVIVVLAVMYRNITDTVLNLISLVMAIIWVYGIGVLLNLNLGNPMMTTVPVLIIGLGIDYGIHYTSRYRGEIKEGRGIAEAVSKSGATVGFAILLTTVTTVVGFMSNLVSNISVIKDFGILCSVGIVSAFILMLTFFPAAKTIIDRRRKKRGKKLVKERKSKSGSNKSIGKRFWSKIGEPDTFCESDESCVNNGLGLGAIAARTPIKVVIVVLLITSVSVYGGAQLEARYDFRDFLPEDLEVTDTFNMVVEDFDFSEETVYILTEGDVTQPGVFKKIGTVQSDAMNSTYAVNARNPESPIELANSMVDENSPNYNRSFQMIWYTNVDKNRDGRIDDDITEENVTAVYDALLEYDKDAKSVLNREDGEYKGMLIRIPVDTQDESKVEQTREDMQGAAEPLKEEDLKKVIVTGGPIVSYSTFKSINEGQIQTLLITFIIALAILTILYLYLRQGWFLGVVTILPLVFVISWTFGTMYFLNIPLNPVTVTIAAITVGLGIDYSIHLTQRFLEDTERISKPECALCVSASHTGSALFGSATTTVVGFGILSLAIIPPLAQFGQVS